MFDLDLASALLLGAVLAPTDPVLASDVQVGPPLEKTKDNIRFSLTAEAGMNDGSDSKEEESAHGRGRTV